MNEWGNAASAAVFPAASATATSSPSPASELSQPLSNAAEQLIASPKVNISNATTTSIRLILLIEDYRRKHF